MNERAVNNKYNHYLLNCAPPHSYVEALSPNVTVFGDRTFKEVIKVK